MVRSQSHRGPDGAGTYLGDGIALGHNRLSLLDLPGGDQPMTNPPGDLWITYSGEIHNHQELREQLIRMGRNFVTRSDTETLLAGYEVWGDELPGRLNGMFSFGIVDLARRRLLLARDPFGIKPLFYRFEGGGLVFASEISAIRAGSTQPLEINLSALDLYFEYQYIPGPETIFKEIRHLEPGQILTCDFERRSSSSRSFWKPQFQADESRSEHSWVERTDTLLRQAVQSRLEADSEVGLFLSGGIDSSLLASRLGTSGVPAFTLSFDGSDCSELEFARLVAERYSLRLDEVLIDEGSLEALPEVLRHHGQPFGDSSALAVWHLARAARQKVKAVLSGDGGDEIFGGYNSYLRWLAEERTEDGLESWKKQIRYLASADRQRLFKPELRVESGPGAFEAVSAKLDLADPLAYAQQMDLATYLPYDILPKAETAGMSHGLEIRPALLDLRLVEHLARLPRDLRIESKTRETKRLAKLLLKRDFDQSFLQRPKRGFSIPRSEWFRPGRRARKFLEERLGPADARIYRWLEPRAVRKMLDDHSSLRDRSGPLWLLLALETWLHETGEA